MYEYGARNYDPAVGRFFSIDNYAESFLDLTPYQYAGNNPVYFIDKNGEYIYIWDEGKGYKFDGGKLFGKDENGNWAVHTPEAGSFLDQVYTALKQMYEFDTGDGSGGSGGSFSNWFLNLFNNNDYNVEIFQKFGKPRTNHDSGIINISLKQIVEVYTANKKFEKSDLLLVIAHELGHALSCYTVNKNGIDQTWLETKEFVAKRDEIFAMIVENIIRSEFNIAKRTHYLGPNVKNDSPSTFERSRIYNENKETKQFELTPQALQIFNDYKKSIQNQGIKWEQQIK